MTPPLRSLLRQSLKEDLGKGDLTTQALIPKNLKGEAVIFARQNGILAGLPVAAEIFRLAGRGLKIKMLLRDGDKIRKGKAVLRVFGRVRSILEAERTALNFLGHLSGVATLTAQFVEKVRGTRAQILDTRKTTPLLRGLEKAAVRAGGGFNHRFGLWEEILVKDNHWAALRGNLGKTHCRYFMDRFVGAGLRARPGAHTGAPLRLRKKIPVEIEVQNLKELAHLLEGSFVPDRVLLDNFSVRELKRAVMFVDGLNQVLRKRYGLRRKRPLLEASGGIHLHNVRAVAQTGVDRISVGALTHSAPALDFSLELLKAGAAL